jgi:hypothetical protein
MSFNLKPLNQVWLKEEYMLEKISKNGGQRWNRTTDTRIFNPHSKASGLY